MYMRSRNQVGMYGGVVECIIGTFLISSFCNREQQSSQRGPTHISAGDIGPCVSILLISPDDNGSHVRCSLELFFLPSNDRPAPHLSTTSPMNCLIHTYT